MSDEPIVMGRLALRPTLSSVESERERWILTRDLGIRVAASMPWSDWLALARKILQREGAVVLEGELATAFKKGRQMGFGRMPDEVSP
jgi:hypothetical protein